MSIWNIAAELEIQIPNMPSTDKATPPVQRGLKESLMPAWRQDT